MATGVIVAGVVAGPGTVSCIQRGDFGACMAETFFGGEPMVAEAEQDPASEEQAVALSDTADEEEGREPAESEDTPTAQEVAEAVMPSFSVVRVEPDGSAVIAGTATPSGEVQIYANDEVIGSETAEPSGDWAYVTERPLDTGGLELRAYDVESEQFSESSVVVVVQDDRQGEPLVVATAPGEASEVLQGLERPSETQVAEAEVAADEREAQDPEPVEVAEPSETADEIEVAQAPGTLAVDAPATRPREDGADEESVDTTEEAVEAPATVANREDAALEAEGAPREDASEPAESETFAVAQAGPSDTAQAEDEPAAEPESTPQPESEPAAEPQVTAEGTEASVSEGETIEAPATDQQETPATEQPQAPVAPEEEPQQPETDTGELATTVAAVTEREAAVEPDAPVETPEPVQPVEDAAPEEAAQQEAAQQDAAQQDAAPEEETAVAAVDPQAAVVPPSIDAVEIDGDRNFFAGGGTDGHIVRLYVDNQPVGTTEVSDGRWLIEAIDVLDEPSQRVRIDMLAEDGSVVGRAEVEFVIDIPVEPEPQPTPDEERTVVAQSEDTAPADEPAALEQPEPAATEQSEAPVTQPDEDADTATDAEAAAGAVAVEPAPSADAEEETAPEPQVTQQTPAEATPEPETDAAPEVEAEPSTQPETGPEPELAPEPEPAPQPEPETDVAATEPEDDAAQPAETEVPTMIGVTEGDRVVSGRAIIRRGDNLWTIARRVYGEGIRYTQIYQANDDQIRDPDLIYPGQVFDLPGTDAVIGEDSDAG